MPGPKIKKVPEEFWLPQEKTSQVRYDWPPANDPSWEITSVPVLMFLHRWPSSARHVHLAFHTLIRAEGTVNCLAWLKEKNLIEYNEETNIWRAVV